MSSATRGGIPARRDRNPRTSYPTKPGQLLPRTCAARPLSQPDCQGRIAAATPLSQPDCQGRIAAGRYPQPDCQAGGMIKVWRIWSMPAAPGGGGDLGQFMLGHEAPVLRVAGRDMKADDRVEVSESRAPDP